MSVMDHMRSVETFSEEQIDKWFSVLPKMLVKIPHDLPIHGAQDLISEIRTNRNRIFVIYNKVSQKLAALKADREKLKKSIDLLYAKGLISDRKQLKRFSVSEKKKIIEYRQKVRHEELAELEADIRIVNTLYDNIVSTIEELKLSYDMVSRILFATKMNLDMGIEDE